MNEAIPIFRSCNVANWIQILVCLRGGYNHIINTDEDPRLRIESFAVINLRGVSSKLY